VIRKLHLERMRCCSFGFGIFALCARWIYWRCFGNRCGTHLHWSRVGNTTTVQKPQNKKKIIYTIYYVYIIVNVNVQPTGLRKWKTQQCPMTPSGIKTRPSGLCSASTNAPPKQF
jgi:hypothetical protein